MPPTVVEVKSPIACTEFTAKSRPSAMQAATSKFMPKGMRCGASNQPELESPEKSTMPKQRATM